MHTLASVSNALPMGAPLPRLDIRFQTIQSSPYRAGLATPPPTAFSGDHRVHGRLLSPRPFGSRLAGDPRTFLQVLPGCTRDLIARDMAHPLCVYLFAFALNTLEESIHSRAMHRNGAAPLRLCDRCSKLHLSNNLLPGHLSSVSLTWHHHRWHRHHFSPFHHCCLSCCRNW